MRKYSYLPLLLFAGVIFSQSGVADRPTEWEQLAKEQREARAALDKAFTDWANTEPDLEKNLLTGDPFTLQQAIGKARTARKTVNTAKLQYYRATQKQLQASLDALKKLSLKPEDLSSANKELDAQESDLRARRETVEGELAALKTKTTERGEDTQSRMIRLSLEGELSNLKELSLNIADQKAQLGTIQKTTDAGIKQREKFLGSYQSAIDGLGKTTQELQRSFGAWDRFYDAEGRLVQDRLNNRAPPANATDAAPRADKGAKGSRQSKTTTQTADAGTRPDPPPPPKNSPDAAGSKPAPPEPPVKTDTPSEPKTYTSYYEGTWKLDLAAGGFTSDPGVQSLEMELHEQAGKLQGRLRLVYVTSSKPIDLELAVSGDAQPRETLVQAAGTSVKAVFRLLPPSRVDGLTMEVSVRQLNRPEIKPFSTVLRRH